MGSQEMYFNLGKHQPNTNQAVIFPPLAGDMDISVLSKYISDMRRVYPAVEGRITFRSSAVFAAHSLGLLLLGLCLSLTLWLSLYALGNCDKLKGKYLWDFPSRCLQGYLEDNRIAGSASG